MVEVWSDGSTIYAVVNGAEQTLTVTQGANDGSWFGDTAGRDKFTIGAAQLASVSFHLEGDFYELLAWDQPLSPSDRLLARKATAARHGITLSA